MNKTILWVLVVILVLLGGWYILSQNDDGSVLNTDMDETNNADTSLEEETSDPDGDSDEEANTVTVTYSASGFSPGEVRINTGDTVVFRDSGTGNMWVASAMHPTHTVYPGSDIDLCGTAQAAGIFDQCSSGVEFRFTFNETGTWAYHNHLQASHFGRVIVE